MSNSPKHLTILVPQGAEYQAVCRGLNHVTGTKPTVVAIPVGIQPLRQFLQQGQNQPAKVLVMGLCGSLQPRHTIGDIVLYEDCVYQGNLQKCESTFTTQIKAQLAKNVSLVKSVTSDRLIWSAAEKRHLHKITQADVVDMEGFATIEFCQQISVPVAILRVVSDDCHHDIPNLTLAISANGTLQPLPLTLQMLRQPLAATRLIRGSLKGLKVLQQVTNLLFSQ
jgi:hypothetical protein